VLDNGGYGCINRLQQAAAGAPFNNLFRRLRGRPGDRRGSISPRTRRRWARYRERHDIAELERRCAGTPRRIART